MRGFRNPAFNTDALGAPGHLPSDRPKMVLFRTIRGSISGFLMQHLHEQVEAFKLWFDVVVIDGPCDYAEVCDKIQPDLCVFETGVYSGPRLITNTQSHPGTPKLGFLHADAFDSSRTAFIADMATWGVEWFFTTSMAMPEYTPEISDRLFVWPNAVDQNVFRDHELAKETEILIIGSQAPHYPWRNAINKSIQGAFNTRVMPHFGWNGEPGTDSMVLGRNYSKILNGSIFVPTCGTMARDVVRKHLEIPASSSCLVTEDTSAVRAMGFRDLENCVFADRSNAVEKLQHLLENRDELERVTRAGHDLVHELHTFEQRNQVLQWLELVKEHGMGVRLRQIWPTGTLVVDPHPSQSPVSSVLVLGRDRQLLREAWEAMDSGLAINAERLFERCLDYFFMPEAAVGMVFAKLAQGDSRAGFCWSTKGMIPPLAHHHAIEPDPVQWACLIRSYLCLGDLAAALVCADMFLDMRNVELDRIRAAAYSIAGHRLSGHEPGAVTSSFTRRPTVCPVPDTPEDKWREELMEMLKACGQTVFAASISLSSSSTAVAASLAARGWRMKNATIRVDTLLKRLRSGTTQSTPERWVRRVLSPLKRALTSNNPTFALQRELESEELQHAVLVFPKENRAVTRAVRAGLGTNPNAPVVEVLGTSPVDDGRVRMMAQAPSSAGALRAEVSSSGRGLLVFISERALARGTDRFALVEADVIVLERRGHRIDSIAKPQSTEALLQSKSWWLSSEGKGWAIYRKSASGNDIVTGGDSKMKRDELRITANKELS